MNAGGGIYTGSFRSFRSTARVDAGPIVWWVRRSRVLTKHWTSNGPSRTQTSDAPDYRNRLVFDTIRHQLPVIVIVGVLDAAGRLRVQPDTSAGLHIVGECPDQPARRQSLQPATRRGQSRRAGDRSPDRVLRRSDEGDRSAAQGRVDPGLNCRRVSRRWYSRTPRSSRSPSHPRAPPSPSGQLRLTRTAIWSTDGNVPTTSTTRRSAASSSSPRTYEAS